MKIIEKVRKSKNKLIEDSYIDFLEFYEISEQNDKTLVEQIKHSIYIAQCDYDDFGSDGNYSIQCINGAKKFLNNILM